MDKNTRISSFGKWISPINLHNLYGQVELHKQGYYTKKLTIEALFPPPRVEIFMR
jgi:hypothetical protein